MSRPITGAEAGRILRVATALRTLLVWFGAHLLLAMGLAVSMFSSLEGGQPSPLLLPLSAVSLALALVVMVLAYRLAQALERNAVLYLLGILAGNWIPLIGLICLVALNGAACRQMRDAGLKIGLLGPNAAERERFARRHRSEAPVEPGL